MQSSPNNVHSRRGYNSYQAKNMGPQGPERRRSVQAVINRVDVRGMNSTGSTAGIDAGDF